MAYKTVSHLNVEFEGVKLAIKRLVDQHGAWESKEANLSRGFNLLETQSKSSFINTFTKSAAWKTNRIPRVRLFRVAVIAVLAANRFRCLVNEISKGEALPHALRLSSEMKQRGDHYIEAHTHRDTLIRSIGSDYPPLAWLPAIDDLADSHPEVLIQEICDAVLGTISTSRERAIQHNKVEATYR